jgi:hypothetical protein
MGKNQSNNLSSWKKWLSLQPVSVETKLFFEIPDAALAADCFKSRDRPLQGDQNGWVF